MAQVYGLVAASRAVRVYVSDDTDARDDGKRGVASTTAVCAFVPNGTDAHDDENETVQIFSTKKEVREAPLFRIKLRTA